MHTLVEKHLPTLSQGMLSAIVRELEVVAENTLTEGLSPRFAALESYIPVKTSEAKPLTKLIAIDIGGTYTRVALRESDKAGVTTWIPLFLMRNYELVDSASTTPPFQQMRSALVQNITSALHKISTKPEHISGVGVVWSNALESYPLSDSQEQVFNGITGTSGLVTGKDKGIFYLKGEPWNPELKDGDDIGKFLLEEFLSNEYPIRSFIIANDTILTQKVIPGSSAGMVASTGTNTTLVFPAETQLRNSEAGNSYLIPEEFQHPADQIEGDAFNIEALIAGRSMQRRFGAHLMYIASLPDLANYLADDAVCALREIKALLSSNKHLTYFKGKDLQALLDRNYERFLELRGDASSLFRNNELLELLTSMTENLSIRGGSFGAALGYISLYHQLKSGTADLLLALDSSQARHLAGYWSAYEKVFKELCEEKFPDLNPSVELINVSKDKILSVPMYGAVRAVNDFLVE